MRPSRGRPLFLLPQVRQRAGCGHSGAVVWSAAQSRQRRRWFSVLWEPAQCAQRKVRLQPVALWPGVRHRSQKTSVGRVFRMDHSTDWPNIQRRRERQRRGTTCASGSRTVKATHPKGAEEPSRTEVQSGGWVKETEVKAGLFRSSASICAGVKCGAVGAGRVTTRLMWPVSVGTVG